MSNNETMDAEVNIELQEVEIKKYDNSQHVGKKVKIGKVSTHSTDRFKDRGITYYCKVVSEVLDVMDNKEKTEVTASRMFNLQKDEDGKIGWSDGSKLSDFLKTMKVSKPDELVGKEVIVLLTDEKNGQRFCTF